MIDLSQLPRTYPVARTPHPLFVYIEKRFKLTQEEASIRIGVTRRLYVKWRNEKDYPLKDWQIIHIMNVFELSQHVVMRLVGERYTKEELKEKVNSLVKPERKRLRTRKLI
jgi:DNA-binding XRE family transcriptional regulator